MFHYRYSIILSVSQYGDCMSVDFSEIERDILDDAASEVEEIHVDYRKQISQRKYCVMENPARTSSIFQPCAQSLNYPL